jgi:xanthine dehydrogenase YagT iron-sulfur-binding subunit
MSALTHNERGIASSSGISRRNFFMATASTAAYARVLSDTSSARAQGAPPAASPRNRLSVNLRINDRPRQVFVDPRTTVLDVLREQFSLTGTKKGCDQGQCGACTVLLDGRRVLSCLTLAASVEGRDITTIEGLAGGDGTLHPMQQAFIDNDAFQCGYCTPGQIMSAVGCVLEGHARTDADIREYMSGNICRCAAYPNIVLAIKQARQQMRQA